MGFMDILKSVFKESTTEPDLSVQVQKNGSYQIDPRFSHNHLREIRVQNNWTQDDVAKRVGITHQAISEMERGRFCPNERLAQLISTAVGKSCEEVFYSRRTKNQQYFSDN